MEIFQEELPVLYHGEKLPPLPISYRDYSEWHNKEKRKDKFKKQEIYWLDFFKGDIPLLHLPTDYTGPLAQIAGGDTVVFNIDREESLILKEFAGEENVTLYMVLLTAFTILLAKLSGQDDIVVGTPAVGRLHPDLERLIGMFVNTLALRTYPARTKTPRDYLQEIKQNTLKAIENQDYQFEELVKQVVVNRIPHRNPLFDVMFTMQHLENKKEEPGRDLRLQPLTFHNSTAKFFIVLEAIETDGLSFVLEYSTRLFKKETIERFAGYFKTILSAVTTYPGNKISDMEIITAREKRRILVEFNSTEVEYPGQKTIRRLFEEQAEKNGDHIAVISPNPDSRETDVPHLTYKKLNEKSNQLAEVLRKKGIERNTIAGLMVGPSFEIIIGIMAILKAGGCYLPLDPDQPKERITYMLKDSKAKLLLTQRALTGDVSLEGETVDINDNTIYRGKGKNPDKINEPTDFLYLIYTSGTTGKSKGVAVKNQNLVNYVDWFSKKVNITGKDRTILVSSFGFDLGYTAVYSSILSGCELHIVSKETYAFAEGLITYISKNGISYIKITPSLFTTIATSSYLAPGMLRLLRLVVLGGEEIKVKDVEKIHSLCPHIQIMNHYGPTEATIGSAAQFIDFQGFGEYVERPTIGKPINNTRLYILDEHLRVLPTGVSGELFISGSCLAGGYLNRPALTSEKFMPNPFIPGERMYRTGDLARWKTDGTIEFLGRIDHQVKIRGYRIELGEIREQLAAHNKIDEAVVTMKETREGERYICAYIVSSDGIEIPGLREYLSASLPHYMIPSYFVKLETLPLTPNGKVDGKALPTPEIKAGVEYVAPGNDVERKLVETWSTVLGIEKNRLGVEDNFFRIGGHSLKGIMV
ncbi:MAG: amino acid adenylation domain-containing protein, partial [bacterium]|nr:amino acid adenylation domain-containing protein [bacterium]